MNKPTDKDYAAAISVDACFVKGRAGMRETYELRDKAAQIIADRVAEECQTLTAERDALLQALLNMVEVGQAYQAINWNKDERAKTMTKPLQTQKKF